MELKMELSNLIEQIKNIQDFIIPKLDTYEQTLYYYIFRHTVLEGKKEALLKITSANIGFGSGSANTPSSGSSRRTKLRNLEQKGFIEILKKSGEGTLIKIILPDEIQNLFPLQIEKEIIDIEVIDFYQGRLYVKEILERENNKCFYCLKKLSIKDCILDHVVPLSKGGNNSYKNIVAASFECNSLKSNKDAENFLRELYRESIISVDELKERLNCLELIKQGELKPKLL